MLKSQTKDSTLLLFWSRVCSRLEFKWILPECRRHGRGSPLRTSKNGSVLTTRRITVKRFGRRTFLLPPSWLFFLPWGLVCPMLFMSLHDGHDFLFCMYNVATSRWREKTFVACGTQFADGILDFCAFFGSIFARNVTKGGTENYFEVVSTTAACAATESRGVGGELTSGDGSTVTME